MPARIGPPRVLVIGSGLAGLAAACRLASRGVQVLLMERREELGGRTSLLTQGVHPESWSWDWESAPLTQRELLDHFWAKLGREFSSDIQLQRYPAPRCFWLDGSEQSLDEDFWHQDLLQPLNLQAQAHSTALNQLAKTRKRPALWRAWQNKLQVKLKRNVSAELAKIPSEKLRQILLQLSTPQGSNPWQTPPSLLLQGLQEVAQAQWRIEGGSAQLCKQLLNIAQELQVETRPLCEVRHIFRGQQSHWRVEYSKLDRDSSHQLDCEGILCAFDTTHKLAQLFSSPQAPQTQSTPAPKQKLALSRFNLCIGLKQPLPNLGARNFFLGNPQQEAEQFQCLFGEGKLPSNPRLEVLLNSRLEPNWAPANGESFQLRTPAPLIGPQIAWASRSRSYAEFLLRHLQEDYGVVELKQTPAQFAIRNPSDYESEFQLPLGSLSGYARHSKFAWRRPANRRRLKQISFAGASTHPGSKLSQTVQSGNFAAEALLLQFQLPL